MIKELKRPSKKTADVKVTDADMVYFSLGLGDSREFILPSQRNDYHSDERAVHIVKAVKAGKRLSNMDFSGVNFKGADLSGGYFEGCSFKGAVFYKTNAQTCDFTNCCFDEAYFEDTDLMGCDLTGATFKRAFWKNNNTQKAFLDEDAEKYLTSLEKIIRLIEAGKLDIRMLSKSDLLCLDIRRLDFSNIDLSELDLSVFALDGINLCGTYIDPKQLMSLEG
ncbi:MAG: pentapeptide repeat-containing protein, partial [Alphaproteobacteria bacterium]|nr:pentapeptide repeat-containing protein [Alphaproteobacteria bacterium]